MRLARGATPTALSLSQHPWLFVAQSQARQKPCARDMEFRALRDLQTWCELPAAEAVRARLEEVAGRMVATPAELSAAFGSVQSVERE